ncbi:MAG: flagellar protein [Chlorobi bacterium]|nr:flagellar protein [Chlorobiota bacterium]
MAQFINGVQVPFVPIVQKEAPAQKAKEGGGTQFDNVFRKELDKLKFSNHASRRLESRNIELSEKELLKLNNAIGKAEAKGAKDSLVMMNDTAFIVNVPNRTVVTAMPVGGGEENVFTNIDSVIFAQ